MRRQQKNIIPFHDPYTAWGGANLFINFIKYAISQVIIIEGIMEKLAGTFFPRRARWKGSPITEKGFEANPARGHSWVGFARHAERLAELLRGGSVAGEASRGRRECRDRWDRRFQRR